MDIVHIRMRGKAVACLKQRAGFAGASPAGYVEIVLWYAGLENARIDERMVGPSIDEDEMLYLSTTLSTPLRRHLIARSEEHRMNLSVYAGVLVERYLATFERDPGDLRMLARVNELLQRENPVTERSLLQVLRLAKNGPVSRMPATYQARWLHQRLSPFLPRIEREGTPVELTVAGIARLWEQQT